MGPARDVTARLLTVVALLAASAAWASWVFSVTVLDPNRSVAIADALVDDPYLQEQVSGVVADTLTTATAGLGVDLATLDEVAARTVASPEAAELLRVGIINSHRAIVADNERVELEVGSVLDVARAELAEVVPAAATVALPETETVELPTDQLAFVSGFADTLRGWRGLATLVAVSGIVVAAVIAVERSRVIASAGMWAVSAGGVIAALAGIARLAAGRTEGATGLLARATDAAFGPVTVASLVLVGVGIVLAVSARPIGRLLGRTWTLITGDGRSRLAAAPVGAAATAGAAPTRRAPRRSFTLPRIRFRPKTGSEDATRKGSTAPATAAANGTANGAANGAAAGGTPAPTQRPAERPIDPRLAPVDYGSRAAQPAAPAAAASFASSRPAAGAPGAGAPGPSPFPPGSYPPPSGPPPSGPMPTPPGGAPGQMPSPFPGVPDSGGPRPPVFPPAGSPIPPPAGGPIPPPDGMAPGTWDRQPPPDGAIGPDDRARSTGGGSRGDHEAPWPPGSGGAG